MKAIRMILTMAALMACLSARAQTVTILHSFSPSPVDGGTGDGTGGGAGGLVQGSDSNFYGTTSNGGTSTNCVYGCGTVFQISPSGDYTVLYSFDGILYAKVPSNDGDHPGGLVQGSDGSFYGVTSLGGASLNGTVFRFSTSGGYTSLHSFSSSDGEGGGGLVQGSDSNFYGIATGAAGALYGTVFRISPSGDFTVLHDFAGPPNEGVGDSFPSKVLVQGSDGNFYGTTSAGGTTNVGTVFRISPSGDFTNLHSFLGWPYDGNEPFGTLVQGSDSNFYGLTQYGGGANTMCPGLGCGTIFRISSTGSYTNLHSFGGPPTDGKLWVLGLVPGYNGLVQGSDGNFYGTTIAGGKHSNGTVFQISPDGSYTILHDFAGPPNDGSNPVGSLMQGSDGNFYGTTYGGGKHSNGTVFQISLSGDYTVLHDFAGSPNDGGSPREMLVQGSDGNFYGTTFLGGTYTNGTVFKLVVGATGATSHDLAVVTLKAPKKITFKSGATSAVGKFSVSIQNNGPAVEIIPSVATLTNLVTVNVQSLSNCPSFFATMLPPKAAFPITLAPKKKLTLSFTANFDCVNDPLATSKTAAHNDYQTVATVDLTALGESDNQTSNDTCPRPPNPAIGDKGCAKGAPVFTDLIMK